MGMRVCIGSIRFVRAVYRIEEEAMTADQLRECRKQFEDWHNHFYGTVGVRSLEMYPDEIGLGYKDETVQAQFALFRDLVNSRPTAVASHAEVHKDDDAM